MNVTDSQAQTQAAAEQAAPASIAIVGMACNFEGAANLSDFWKLICFGIADYTADPKSSADSSLATVITAALAERGTVKEQQQQAALRIRRQLANARLASNPPTRQPKPDAAHTRLLIAVAGDHATLDPDSLAPTAAADECTVQRHTTSMQALSAVVDALSQQQCELGVVAAMDMGTGASGALVLMRASDALRDDERIYASIRGVALEAAPSTQLPWPRWYARWGVDPTRITLLECAGSVAPTEPSAELAQLDALFGNAEYPSVLLGASAASRRDASAVAGLASVIKTALALYHRILPATPPTVGGVPHALPAKSRLYARSKLSPWIAPLDTLRLAAVNQDSGASLAHLVLEEPPAQQRLAPQLLTQWLCELIILSAPTLELLLETLARLRTALDSLPANALADLAHTLALRHSSTDRYRITTVVHNIEELKQKLARTATRLSSEHDHNWTDFSGIFYGCQPAKGKLAILFPGVGFPGLSGAYADRIGELALHFPELRWWLDLAESTCGGDGVPYPLRFQLYPPDDFDPATLAKIEEELKWSQRAAIGTQIANLATCQLARSLGLTADAMAGFSLGEWSALVAAGFIDSQGIEEWQRGFAAGNAESDPQASLSHRGTWAMASASAEQVEAILKPLGEAVAVTLDVSSTQVFFGGDHDDMATALSLLKDAGIWAMPLPADGPMAAFSAFHTKHAAAFVDNMRKSLESLPLRTLDCIIYSSGNAKPFPLEPKDIVPLIVDNATRPVRLRNTISVMYRDGFRIFLQLGGGGKLLPTVEKILGLEPHVALSIDVEYLTGLQQFQYMLARLLALGLALQPLGLFRSRTCRTLDLNLPNLPRQRTPQAVATRVQRASPQQQHAARAAIDKAAGTAPPRQTRRIESAPSMPPVVSQRAAVQTSETAALTHDANAALDETAAWPVVGDIQRLVPGEQLDSILTLDLAVHRFLGEHVLIQVPDNLKPASERLPTLPFAFSIEIICEAARTLVPSLCVIACHDVEQVKFVTLKSAETLAVWIRARRTSESTVSVEFGIAGDSKAALRGTVQMAHQPLELPTPFDLQHDRPCPHDAEWLYGTGPFFHGPLWRIIRSLDRMSQQTLLGRLEVPELHEAFYVPMQRTTLFNPVLLDGVAQMFNYRDWLERQRFFVPIAVKRITFNHRLPAPKTLVEARIRFRELDARRIEGDFVVLDAQGGTVMQAEGWREWWVIWPKCFFQTNHLARVAQVANEWTDVPGQRQLVACRVNQSAFLDADADFVARLYLTQDEWRQYQQQRRVDWLLGRIAAKDAVRTWYRTRRGRQLHPLEVSIETPPGRAPVVVAPADEHLHLSLACIDDEAVAAVSVDHAVGVDIAAIKPREPAFLEVLFDATEMGLLPLVQRLEWVHRGWAAKEALCKMSGAEHCSLDRVRIRRVHEQQGVIEVASSDQQPWEVHTIRDKSCVLAITWQARGEQHPDPAMIHTQPDEHSTAQQPTHAASAMEAVESTPQTPPVLTLSMAEPLASNGAWPAATLQKAQLAVSQPLPDLIASEGHLSTATLRQTPLLLSQAVPELLLSNEELRGAPLQQSSVMLSLAVPDLAVANRELLTAGCAAACEVALLASTAVLPPAHGIEAHSAGPASLLQSCSTWIRTRTARLSFWPFGARPAHPGWNDWMTMLTQPASGASTPPYEPARCVLRVRELRKRYGFVQALDNASFNLGAGEIVGLLGQNGSGKTTLLSALMGRVKPDSGSIAACPTAPGMATGMATRMAPRMAPRMGWVPQQLAIYPFMTARENLLTFGRYQGIADQELADRVEQALHWAGLEDRADDTASSYSFGMMRRLNVCIGVLDQPPIVLMDEPTLGVDVQSRERMHQMVHELRMRGTAILYTSHYIEEVERLCDRILIIDNGRIICEGTTTELINRTVGSAREVEIHSMSLSAEMQGLLQARGLALEGDRILTRIEDIGHQLPPLLEQLRRDNVPIHNLVIRQPTLAGAFLKLTGRSLPA